MIGAPCRRITENFQAILNSPTCFSQCLEATSDKAFVSWNMNSHSGLLQTQLTKIRNSYQRPSSPNSYLRNFQVTAGWWLMNLWASKYIEAGWCWYPPACARILWAKSPMVALRMSKIKTIQMFFFLFQLEIKKNCSSSDTVRLCSTISGKTGRWPQNGPSIVVSPGFVGFHPQRFELWEHWQIRDFSTTPVATACRCDRFFGSFINVSQKNKKGSNKQHPKWLISSTWIDMATWEAVFFPTVVKFSWCWRRESKPLNKVVEAYA